MEAQTMGIEGWLQLATSTGFAGLVWYLIVISLPKMQDKFDAFAKDQQTRFENQIDKQNAHHEGVVKAILDRHEKMITWITGKKID
jgi:hypothetical protein